jgi:hypothetical protein
VQEVRRGVGGWTNFHSDERLQQALDHMTPHEVFQAPATFGYVDGAGALTTSSQAHQPQKRDSIEIEKAL